MKISLEELLKACENFVQNPSSEREEVLTTFKSQLIIRNYLPLREKVVALYKILSDTVIPEGSLGSVFAVKLEVSTLFNGLLVYTNIESPISYEKLTYENYDLLYQSGVVDYILQYCQQDYNKLISLIDYSLDYHHLLDLIETLKKVDTEHIDKILYEMKSMRETMDPVSLQNISDIVKYNDPNLYQLGENFKEEALDKILRADTLEKNK